MVLSKRSRNSKTYWSLVLISVPSVSPVHSSFRICTGPRTVLPCNNLNVEDLVAFCGASLYANSKRLTEQCHWRGCSLHRRLSIFLSVPSKRSTNPLQVGWYRVAVGGFIDSNLDTSSMHFDTNCVPRSLKTSSGIPRRL